MIGDYPIARVFPRRTAATPVDPLAFVGGPPLPGLRPEVAAVHISVTFTWDLPAAERLAEEWCPVADVTLGGPATGERGGGFVPGRYLARGYVVTSRGCPNRCPFCAVWQREGNAVRELPITDGWNVLDDNLLACSEAHIRAVFAMLARQRGRWPYRTRTRGEVRYRVPEFTGGLEAARLRPWHVEELARLKPGQLFFAYDEARDLEPLIEAGKLLRAGGFVTDGGLPASSLRCYVLVGYDKRDTPRAAEARLRAAIRAGFLPMAMVYAPPDRDPAPEWVAFADPWIRPAEVRRRVPEEWRAS